MMRIVGTLCRIVGLYLLVSAAVKALDPWGFALQIQTYGIIRQALLVRLIALGVIGVEALLGATLLVGASLRGWTLKFTAALLAGFTGLLAYGWLVRGLDDCGCMGTYIPMKPHFSILKNLIMLGIVGFGIWGERRGMWGRGKPLDLGESIAHVVAASLRTVRIVVFAQSLTVVVVLLGVGLTLNPQGRRTAAPVLLPGDAARGADAEAPARRPSGPYARFVFALEDGTRRDLGIGPQMAVFMSTSCDHCEVAVPIVNQAIAELGPFLPPVTGLMLGEEETLRAFHARTRPEFPLVLIDPLVFFERIGRAPPRFVLINDANPVAHWDEEFPSFEELLPYLDELMGDALDNANGPDAEGVS